MLPSTVQPNIFETFRAIRKELRNFRQIAHWNYYLVQRKAKLKQFEFGNAVDHGCQTLARGPNLARRVISFGPWGNIKLTLELARWYYKAVELL